MKTTFNPGPSQLYFTVADHLKDGIRDGVASISHRSKKFEEIFREATEGLRELLSLPNDYCIFFLGSATEIQERSIQNLVIEHSTHFVNASFSKRYFEIAKQCGKSPIQIEATQGKAFDISETEDTELIALTHNETSTGVSMPLSLLHGFREKHPSALISVDAVSSLPYPAFDYSKLDSVFFSVQKGFGLPAGLGVWLVNEKCIAKAETLLSKNISIGSFHNLPTLHASYKKNQTPETPNGLYIYLLGKVVRDFLRRGISTIRRETDYKAAILYQTLNNHSLLKPFVVEETIQSKTVIVAETGSHTERLKNYLLSKEFQPGSGYGEFKSSHLRFGNFPAHSKEQYEMLVDYLNDFS